MINCRQKDLYVARRSIDRLSRALAGKVPEDVLGFIDAAWGLLDGSVKRVALSTVDRRIGRLIADEQDGGYEECLENKFYYALSDLLLYLKEGDLRSLGYVLTDALEFVDYQAANDFLIGRGVDAMILDAEDEAAIAGDPRVCFERKSQAADRVFAESVTSWVDISLRRQPQE